MAEDVIIALDFPGESETMAFLDLFHDKKPYVKIGMELFYAMGSDAVKEIKRRGHRIFLDLKLHDIPNTVKSAMAVLSKLNVDMTNLHAAGGSKMMEAALEGLTRPDGTRPLLSGNAAHLHVAGDAGKRPAYTKADGAGCRSLCQNRRGLRSVGRCLLAA